MPPAEPKKHTIRNLLSGTHLEIGVGTFSLTSPRYIPRLVTVRWANRNGSFMRILKWNHGSQTPKKAFRFPMQTFHAWPNSPPSSGGLQCAAPFKSAAWSSTKALQKFRCFIVAYGLQLVCREDDQWYGRKTGKWRPLPSPGHPCNALLISDFFSSTITHGNYSNFSKPETLAWDFETLVWGLETPSSAR